MQSNNKIVQHLQTVKRLKEMSKNTDVEQQSVD